MRRCRGDRRWASLPARPAGGDDRAHRDVVRARIVLAAADGVANAQIAPSWVCRDTARWRRRFCRRGLDGLKDRPRSGRPPWFTPVEVAEVKALACSRPAERGLPLTRWSVAELAGHATAPGLVRPSRVHGPPLAGHGRDQAVAAPVLDLSPRPRLRGQGRPGAGPVRPRWEGVDLGEDEYVISADEKSQLQALRRRHPDRRRRPGGPGESSSNTAAAAPWPTSPPTTSTTPA